MTAPSRVAALFAIAASVACANARQVEAPRYDPTDQTKAQASKSALLPLLIEWPAADRAALEAQRARGVVVVRYSGGEMELLPGCRAKGAYRYSALTPKEETVVIASADELQAALPIHGARVEAALGERKRLEVSMLVVGTFDADVAAVGDDDLGGDCARATHVVRALTVGAFTLASSAASEAAGGVHLAGIGAGGRSASSKEILNRDGRREACTKTGARDDAPPFECGAVLRAAMLPIARRAAATTGACPDGYARNGDACAPIAPDRPPLIDVLKSGN